MSVVHEQQLKFVDRLSHNRKLIHSGPKIDRDVATYVHGLANRTVGSLHPSFDSAANSLVTWSNASVFVSCHFFARADCPL